LEVPSSGAVLGFTTVTLAASAAPRLEAGTVTAIWVLLMELGVRLAPLKFTVAPEAKPVPKMVSCRFWPVPGAVAAGDRLSMKGVGFCA
jgi:hypothetical protein